jgi:pyruvate-formate lyase-activating enzyme
VLQRKNRAAFSFDEPQAHHLSEHEEQREYRMPQAVEIAEAIVLAVVAITTAWSGSNP